MDGKKVERFFPMVKYLCIHCIISGNFCLEQVDNVHLHTRMYCMHETLSSLVARAFTGNRRPLEYYLRDQSRLPGTRANLELVNSLSNLLIAIVPEQPEQVWMLVHYLVQDEKTVVKNTPDEFVVLCGV